MTAPATIHLNQARAAAADMLDLIAASDGLTDLDLTGLLAPEISWLTVVQQRRSLVAEGCIVDSGRRREIGHGRTAPLWIADRRAS